MGTAGVRQAVSGLISGGEHMSLRAARCRRCMMRIESGGRHASLYREVKVRGGEALATVSFVFYLFFESFYFLILSEQCVPFALIPSIRYKVCGIHIGPC